MSRLPLPVEQYTVVDLLALAVAISVILGRLW